MKLSLSRPRHVLPLLLVAAGLSAIPSGIALRWLVPSAWDPVWARALICLACLGLAEALRRGLSAHRARQAVRVLAVGAAVWVVALVWGNGFPAGTSSGVLPLLAMCLLGFPTIAESAAFTVFFSVLVGAAGVASGHGMHAAGLVVSCVTLGSVLGLATAHRNAMAHRLRRSRDELESQVRERTVELRKEVEVRREAEALAISASEAKSRFLANMSHELRTPLNAIQGYAELCAEVADDDEAVLAREEIRRDLGRVLSSADRLLALVNDVLDLARVEAGMMELQLAEVRPAEVVVAAMDEVRPLIDAGGNRLDDELDALPGQLITDAARLRQILVNLLGNAAKFTDDGVITVAGRVHRGAVEISVSDTGTGIPAEALPTLFDRFTQVDDSSTRKHSGTGLGLALSRDLARRMGGELSARSEYGRGSVFTVRLPLDAPAAAA